MFPTKLLRYEIVIEFYLIIQQTRVLCAWNIVAMCTLFMDDAFEQAVYL